MVSVSPSSTFFPLSILQWPSSSWWLLSFIVSWALWERTVLGLNDGHLLHMDVSITVNIQCKMKPIIYMSSEQWKWCDSKDNIHFLCSVTLTPVSMDGQQMSVSILLHLLHLHLFCHSTTEKRNTPCSYLFLVLASNRNEADYTSKIDNFMLPN